MAFKALTGLGPDYLEQLFNECNNDIFSLRSKNTKLALPKHRTNFLKRSFSYRAAKSWNYRAAKSRTFSLKVVNIFLVVH